MDAPIAFVEAAEEDGAELHGPDPIGHLVEPHVVLGEHVADVDPGVVPADAAH